MAGLLQKQIERACKGVRDAGLTIRKVVVTAGEVVVFTDAGTGCTDGDESPDVLAAREELDKRFYGKNTEK